MNAPRNLPEAHALLMLDAGITPVRLGVHGDALKIPQDAGWQTAVITHEGVTRWFDQNPGTNIGARGGRNFKTGLYLARLDFDANAAQNFPIFEGGIGDLAQRLVISKTGKGFHVWFYAAFPLPNKCTAGAWEWVEVDGGRKRKRRVFVELKADGGQVVAPGSRHPSGFFYYFLQGDYASIPALTEGEVRILLDTCRHFDQGAGVKIPLPGDSPLPNKPPTTRPKPINTGPHDNTLEAMRQRFDVLAYATKHMVYGRAETKGDEVRLTDNGGFIVNMAINLWYCFSDEVGGDCFDLIGWLEHGPAWFDNKRDLFSDVLKKAAVFTSVALPDFSPAYQVGDAVTAVVNGAVRTAGRVTAVKWLPPEGGEWRPYYEIEATL